MQVQLVCSNWGREAALLAQVVQLLRNLLVLVSVSKRGSAQKPVQPYKADRPEPPLRLSSFRRVSWKQLATLTAPEVSLTSRSHGKGRHAAARCVCASNL